MDLSLIHIYCAIDCNLDFYVEDNRIMKVVPTKGYPVNDGFCCIKAVSYTHLMQALPQPAPNPLRPQTKR